MCLDGGAEVKHLWSTDYLENHRLRDNNSFLSVDDINRLALVLALVVVCDVAQHQPALSASLYLMVGRARGPAGWEKGIQWWSVLVSKVCDFYFFFISE